MPSRFTPELIARCQEIYSRRSGLDVTPEQADIILGQLAAYGDVAAQVFYRTIGKTDEETTCAL
jgi:hypothetical protein